MLDRPWIRRAMVGAAVLVVAAGVTVRLFRHPGAGDSGSESGWASRRDRGPASPKPAEVDDYVRRMREAHAKELKELAGVPPSFETALNDHLTPEEAIAARKLAHAYPGAMSEIVFEPTPRLREVLAQVESLSRASVVGSVGRYRAQYGKELADAGLTEPVDAFAEALAQGKTIEEALREVLGTYGVRGQKAVDWVFDSKLEEYQRRLASYRDQPDKAYKMDEYAQRIEMLLMLQIETQKSISYRRK